MLPLRECSKTTIFRGRFPGMARLAECLMIGTIPEKFGITFMWNDVIHLIRRCVAGWFQEQTMDAQDIGRLAQECLAVGSPLPGIPALVGG
jgi:hypothetical protein